MEYICLERASKSSVGMPGTGTIISYYRKKKSKNILETKEKYYHSILDSISANDSEGYGDDNSICPICMENKRKIIILPCKHLFCNNCTQLIMKEKEICPICRGLILYYFDFSKNGI